MSTICARIVNEHSDLGDDRYHEWITLGERVKADRLGRPNPPMSSATWTRWICNNGDCTALALVSDDGQRTLIEEAEGSW